MKNNKNYYMPAEWEKHERTFIEWPVKESLVWPDNHEEVIKGYANVINAIAEFEKVTLLVNEDTYEEAKSRCKENVEFLTIPHNDAWCRDNGPTFVWDECKNLAAINWNFNAWGERFTPYDLDNQVASKIIDHVKVKGFDADIVLEGGSIHVDGEGTLLTTKECLLNKNRNPNLSMAQIEEQLKSYLGIKKIIWLNQGLYGDETDGHVDNVACFAKPGVILLQTCKDPLDPNYKISEENLEILRNATDARGRKITIIEIPQPPARYYKEVRLTLSYLNFYIVNQGIILPIFGQEAKETDKLAIEILSKVFPEQKVVTVDGMSLIKEGGNVHCITQQMPAGNII
ncbi:agmatine deiminase family protein [Candidatus Galacturonibacter soehngenii]|uniref:Agmatine deiminase family protein n=1 Tax=Candidatus Galacturonatibacter soehngenii TaxID=2307010 RepID=A0A7V7QIG7_9FIRM|nr:agmatine deiminase family protein [Candidatus Galacturonibacter soehngenii]KAB1435973.1 agmatine deiminase family protein [Candidatus Galacturonibacter soehngenii]